MNYLVVRDDLGGFDQRTPSFNCWWFADDVELAGRTRPLQGPVRRGHRSLRRRAVAGEALQGHFHPQPVRADRRQPAPGQVRQAVQREAGALPRRRPEGPGVPGRAVPLQVRRAAPDHRELAGRQGASRSSWKGETHYVLLDTRQHDIDADGIQARAACLVRQGDATRRTSRCCCPPAARPPSAARSSKARARWRSSSRTGRPASLPAPT